jgi:hypothetical protein
MYVLYTDDSILAGPDQAEMDKWIDDMKKVGLDLTVEGDLNDFLRININRDKQRRRGRNHPHVATALD